MISPREIKTPMCHNNSLSILFCRLSRLVDVVQSALHLSRKFEQEYSMSFLQASTMNNAQYSCVQLHA